MIHRHKIVGALEAKADLFAGFDREFRDNSAFYERKLAEFTACEYEKICKQLSLIDSPGALPSEEFKRAEKMAVHSDEKWTSHETARQWAYKKLLGHPTFAADGSQIMPSKDLSLPVAAVHIAWFENPHTPD